MSLRILILPILIALLLTAISAQAQTMLLDVGGTPGQNAGNALTTSPDANGNTWNNITNLTTGVFTLSTISGASSGITLSATNTTNAIGQVYANATANWSGTVQGITDVTTAVSAVNKNLAISTALQDGFYNSIQTTLNLSGLNINETYDFTLVDARYGAIRATTLQVAGSNTLSTLIAFTNTAGSANTYWGYGTINGITPTSVGGIAVNAIAVSTNGVTFDFLNAMQITGYAPYTNGVATNISVTRGYSGDTLLGGNTDVTASAAGALGNGSSTLLAVGNSTLTLSGFNQTVTGLSGTGNLTLNASGGSQTLTVNSTWGTNNLLYNTYGIGSITYSTYGGVLSGTGALEKSGNGTLVLTGANTYSGGTKVSGGTLSITSAGNIASGALTMNGGTLSFSSPLTLSAFTNTSGSSILNYTTGIAAGAGTTTLLTASSASSISLGGNALTLTSSSLGANSLTLNGPVLSYQGFNYLFTNSGSNFNVVVTASGGRGPWNLTWAGGDAAWNTTAGVWYATNNGASTNVFQDFDNATFTNGASVSVQTAGVNATGVLLTNNSGTLTLSNGTISAVTFTNAGSGNVLVSSSINLGTNTLVNAGSGTLTLNASNAMASSVLSAGKTVLGNANALGGSSAALTMNGGVLDLSNNSITPASLGITAGSVTNSGALATFGTAGSGTVSGTIDGNIALNKSGSGNLILGGANSFSGGVTVNGGTLTLTNVGTLGASTNSVSLAANATLDLGNGSTKSAGTVTLTNGSAILNGTLSATNYLITAVNSAVTLSANIGGTGALNMQNMGETLTLSGNNSYSGGTFVLGANQQIYVGNTNAFGTGAITLNNSDTTVFLNQVGNNKLNNNAINLSNNITFAVNNLGNGSLNFGTGAVTLAPGAFVNLNQYGGGSMRLDGVISGDSSSTLNWYGGGNLILGGSNSFVGRLIMNANNGSVTLANTNALRNAKLELGLNNTLLFGVAGTNTYNLGGLTGGRDGAATITLSGGNSINVLNIANNYFTGVIAGTGQLIISGTADLALGATSVNTYSGGTVVNSGSFTPQNVNAMGTGGVTVNGGTLNLYSLSFTNSLTALGGGTISGGTITNDGGVFSVQNGTISATLAGTSALNKSGSGTVTLSGANSYSGGTTVNGGTLAITSAGNIASGALTMNGGTLSFSSPLTLSAFTNSASSLLGYTGSIPSGAGTTTLLTAGSISLNSNALSLICTNVGTNSLTLNGPALTYQGYDYLFTNSGTNLAIVVADARRYWNLIWAGGSTGSWNTNSPVWYATTNGSSNNVFQDFDSATFTNAASISVAGAGVTAAGVLLTNNSGTLTMTGGTIGAETFTNAGSGNVDISSSINLGSGTLVNAGSGTLTLGAPNTMASSVLSTGKTVLGNTNALGGSSAALTMNGGVLDLSGNSITPASLGITAGSVTNSSGSRATFGTAGSGTVGGTIDGNIALNKSGSGTLTLLGANTYSGGTTVNGGQLTVTGAGTLGVTINALTLTGGTIDLGATTQTQGAFVLSGGTLQNGTLNATSFSLTNGTISASLAGNGSLSLGGNGTVTLSGSNSYSGGTTLNGGQINLGNASAFGTGTITVVSGVNTFYNLGSYTALTGNNAYNLNGGTFQVGANGRNLNLGAGNVKVTGFNNINAWDGGFEMDGVVSGSGTLNWYGSGSLILGGSNTFAGQLSASAGTVVLNNTNALRAATLNNTGANVVLGLAGANVYNLAALSGAGTITLGSNSLAITSTLTNGYYPGVISGTGGFILASGTMSLAGSNTYSGGTVVNGGLLNLNSAGTMGTGGLTVNGGTVDFWDRTITNSLSGMTGGSIIRGTLTNDGGTFSVQNGTISATLAGTSALNKSGSGTVTLNGTNSYTGGTAVTNGSLVLANSNALGAGSLTISNATLDTASLANFKASLGGADMMLKGGGIVRISNSMLESPVFDNVGTLLMTNSGNLFVNTVTNNFSTGTYTLVYASTISAQSNGAGYVISGVGTASLNGPPFTNGTTTYRLTNTAAELQLVVVGDENNLTWTGAYSSDWNTTTTNWIKTNGVGGTFIDGDNVTFTGLGTTNINVVGTVRPGEIIITNNTGTVTLGGGAISVRLGMTNSDSATVVTSPLTLASVNLGSGSLTLAGSTTITTRGLSVNGGTLNVSNAVSVTAGGVTLGSGTIAGSGTITATAFNLANSGLIAANLAGSGTLTKRGSGTVTLSGTNTYSGGTLVTNGTLIAGNSNALTANPVTVSGGTLDLGGNTFTNIFALYGGTISNGTISSGSFTLLSNGTVAATLSGSATLLKSGTGTLTLSGNNGYTGGTFITGGLLVVGNASALGNAANSLSLSSGTLTNGGYNVTVGAVILDGGAIIGSGTLTGTGFTANNTGTLLIANSLGGTGAFTQSGSGSTTLSAPNNYTGGTFVTNGTLIAGNSNALTANPVTVSGGTLDLGGNTFTNIFTLHGGTISNGTISNDGDFTLLSNGTVAATLSGLGALLKSGTGTLTISGNNGYTGGTVITGGLLVVGNAFALGNTNNTLDLSSGTLSNSGYSVTLGAVTLGNGSITGSGTLTGAGFTATNTGSLLIANSLRGSGVFTQSGSGSTTLSSSNNYSGGTMITNGTVLANNARALGFGGLTLSNATLSLTNASTVLRVGNGISIPGGASITLARGSSVNNTGAITVSGISNSITLATNWSFAAGTYALLSGTNIYGATNTSISLSNTIFGRLAYGGTTNVGAVGGFGGTNFTFTNSGKSSLVLLVAPVIPPLQTMPNSYTSTIPAAATNGGVKAISVNPWGLVAASLNGNGEIVPWGGYGAGLTNWPSSFTNGVTAISAGYNHLMALKNGRVHVLGGENGESDIPPAALSGITAISAGTWSCLALKQDGTLVAWGWKYNYRYANQTKILNYNNESYTIRNAALAVANVNLTVQQSGDKVGGISDGTVQGLALFQGGSVVAFGGGLNPNTTGDPSVEIPNNLGTNVAAISEGGFFAMALKKDGTVVAWGQNGSGQTNVPSGLTAVKSLSAGFNYALALKTDGTVVAWGNNSGGQTNVPSGFQGGITAVEAGYSYSVVARPYATLKPVDDCQSSGGLQNGGGGGGAGGVGNRLNPLPRSNPAPRSLPMGSSSSGSSSAGAPGNRVDPSARSAPPSR